MLYHPIIIPLTSKIDLDKTNPFEPGILAWPWSPSCIAANEVLDLALSRARTKPYFMVI